MDINTQRRALRILHKWFLRDANVTPYVERSDIKPAGHMPVINRLEDVSPESEGIRSEYILSYLNKLKNCAGLNMQTVTIARNGKVISRASFFPYSADYWHISHSMCKSLISFAIGYLIEDGLLSENDSAAEILKDSISQAGRILHGGIKIRHLLTMSTGIRFNETGVITDTDWVRAFFDSTSKFRPGTDFEYNSMNTYILAAIVCRITGRTVSEFLGERLFGPLGIVSYHWEKCPMGIEKGGFGLYIAPEDMLKIGIAAASGGIYEGKRVLPEKYLKEAMHRQIKTPPHTGKYDYGYQIWCKYDGSVCIFNGMFGQNVIIFPKIRTVVMTTAGSEEVFQRSRLYDITEKYFGGNFRPAGSLPEDPEALVALRHSESHLYRDSSDAERLILRRGRSIPVGVLDFEGEYTVSVEDGTGISLLPELYQLVHNNFGKGLHGLRLAVEGDVLLLTFVEGDGERTVRVGFSGAERSYVEYGGETLPVLGYGIITDGANRFMRIHLCFPELPNTRIITVKRTPSGISVKFDETPGRGLFIKFIKQSINDRIMKKLERADGTEIVLFEKRVDHFMRPTVNMTRKNEN